MSAKVISDTRVLEISSGSLATALCGRLLSDLGADVESIDSGLTGLNGRSDQGWEALRRRIAEVDVLVVDRSAFHALCGRGLDAKALENLSPRLVYCCISPFGLTGALRDVEASELTVQAAAGVLRTNGYPDDPPLRAGVPVAASGGAIFGLIAILAALYERRRSDLGQFIDQSEYDSLLAFLGTLLPVEFLNRGGQGFRRIGNRHTMSAPWNAYRTEDGWIVLATMGQSQWRVLVTALGRPELADDPRFADADSRIRHVAEIDSVIESWTLRRTTAHAIADLGPTGLPVGPVLDLQQAAADEHFAARRMAVPEGGRTVVGSPLKLVTRTTPATDPDRADSEPAPRHGEVPAGDAQSHGPLTGIRVLEVGSFTAGPIAGRLLGMLGAEVVKIEPPAGEGSRHLGQRLGDTGYLYFINNTDKFGCTLSLEDPRGHQAFLELARTADVFIANLAPNTLRDLGLDYERLAAAKPSLIYCAVSGYGLDGPYSGRKAFDTVVQAISGIMDLTGFPDGPPLKVGMSVADLFGGCIGVAGVVAALLGRENESAARLVDASMFDMAIWLTHTSWPGVLWETPHRIGNRDRHRSPHNCFETSDGHVAIAVTTDQQWRALATAIGRPELADDPLLSTSQSRLANIDQGEGAVQAWCRQRTAAEAAAVLSEVGVPAAVPLSLSDVITAPQTIDRNLIVVQDHPEHGPIRVIGSPFKLSRTPAGVTRRAPQLGEHNDLFLAR